MANPPSSAQLQTFYNQWIWMVPFTSYAPGQTDVQISSTASLCANAESCPSVTTSLQSTVPMPFGDVFELKAPTVLSVNPTCVNAGNAFTIAVPAMVPSLVTAVLIDGKALDPAQYTTVSDTAITAIAPEMSGEALTVVVQTHQEESNDSVTIEISTIDICDLTGVLRGRPSR